MRVISRVVFVCACFWALTFTNSAAAATCYSSTPNATTYSDPIGDAEGGLAPDVTAGSVAVDGACNLTVGYSIAGESSMLTGEFLGWFINSDNNLATGSQSGFKGADFAVGRLPSGYSGVTKYNAATSSFETYKNAQSSGSFGVQIPLGDLDAAPGTTFTVAGAASWDGLYDTYYDWAPNIGLAPASLALQFTSQAPQSNPTASTTPVSTTPVSTPSDPSPPRRACRVPLLKGLSVRAARSRLRAANCKLGKVKRVRSRKMVGRVIRSNPRSGARLANDAAVDVIVGKARKNRRLAGSSAETARLINDLDAGR